MYHNNISGKPYINNKKIKKKISATSPKKEHCLSPEIRTDTTDT
jgi:hypothetical protein